MACIVDGDINDRYARTFVELPDGVAALQVHLRAHEVEPGWGVGIGTGLNVGMVIPPGVIPKRGRLKIGKRLHEFVNLGGWGKGVSERFRQIVEAIEPNVHQFFPIEISTKDGVVGSEQYYMLNVATRIDALIPELSDLMTQGNLSNPGWGYTWKGGGERRLSVNKSLIAGRAMWVERHFSTYGPFFSGELLASIRRAKLEGIYCKMSADEV